jgi:hypothetical protein
LNCSSKLQFCCDVNSELGDRLFPGGGEDLVGVTCDAGGVPLEDDEVGPEMRLWFSWLLWFSWFSWFSWLLSWLSFPNPKLLSAIEFIMFCGCGKMGGKLGGMSDVGTPLMCERGEVRYSLLKASSPAKPSGGGSFIEGGVCADGDRLLCKSASILSVLLLLLCSILLVG